MRLTGCSPVIPWKCALVWGMLGMAIGFAGGMAALARPAAEVACAAAVQTVAPMTLPFPHR